MNVHTDVTALAAAIRDHRPSDLYTNDGARMMWYALVGAAGLALFGDDERARREFLALCEIPPLH
jgi:hypothetical protein